MTTKHTKRACTVATVAAFSLTLPWCLRSWSLACETLQWLLAVLLNSETQTDPKPSHYMERRHMLVAHHYETARQPLQQQPPEALNFSEIQVVRFRNLDFHRLTASGFQSLGFKAARSDCTFPGLWSTMLQSLFS